MCRQARYLEKNGARSATAGGSPLVHEGEDVHPKWIYAYLQRKPKTEKNQLLVESVKRIHKESKESYGSRRISEQLCSEGYHVGRVKAKSLMKKAGIEVKTKANFLIRAELTTETCTPFWYIQ